MWGIYIYAQFSIFLGGEGCYRVVLFPGKEGESRRPRYINGGGRLGTVFARGWDGGAR